MKQIVAAVLTMVSLAAFEKVMGQPNADRQQVTHEDRVRVAEFYRLAAEEQDRIWPGWSEVPAPLLLVTEKTEFLTHDAHPPQEFEKVDGDWYARPRQFDTHLLATFPAFGGPSVIVIGQAENTDVKTSTPWVITVMHEHFHQLQDDRPGMMEAMKGLGLQGDDKTGMWMLNYPFPYEKTEVAAGFRSLRDLLLDCLAQKEEKEFRRMATAYAAERERVFAALSANDRKYLSFQLWKEGIARYTQVKAAEEAMNYKPTADFAALADYESFAAYGARARADTLAELKKADLAKSKRVFVYPFGAAEGFLLDRWNPGWKSEYFKHPLTTEELFAVGAK
jgi:hypothetical protein